MFFGGGSIWGIRVLYLLVDGVELLVLYNGFETLGRNEHIYRMLNGIDCIAEPSSVRQGFLFLAYFSFFSRSFFSSWELDPIFSCPPSMSALCLAVCLMTWERRRNKMTVAQTIEDAAQIVTKELRAPTSTVLMRITRYMARPPV